MTKVKKEMVKCAICGTESEQVNVYSVNYSLGSKEDNDNLINSKQKCPKCGYKSKDISKRDYVYKENEYMKIAIPSYWTQYKEISIGNPFIKLNSIGSDNVKVMFKFGGEFPFAATIYGRYAIEKLGTGSKEIYEKEFNKIVEAIKIDNKFFNIIRLSDVKIDGKNIKDSNDLCVKRIYLEYLQVKTINILDLVWAKGEIYLFTCPVCESTDKDNVFENPLVKVENSIISSIIIKKSDNELINKIDDKIEKLEKKEMLINKLDKKIEELEALEDVKNNVHDILNEDVEKLEMKKIDEDTFYFYEKVKGGKAIIISKDGTYLVAASAISYEQHLEEFRRGEKNIKISIKSKREMLHKKIEESKYMIGYSKGSLINGDTKFTSIIIVDDLIYKAIDGQVKFIENQKEVIDEVWKYINLMQGNIRSEAERVKQLPRIEDNERDQITFKINGEMFTLTSKINDESGVKFYNSVVNEMLNIIK